MLPFILMLACTWGEPAPGSTPARLVRLTHTQWDNTVVTLLGLDGPTDYPEQFLADIRVSTFDNDAAGLSVSPTLWQQYQTAAEALAQQVVEDPTLFAGIAPDLGPSAAGVVDAGAQRWIASFGRRAFRRELSSTEVDTYASLFAEGRTTFQSGDPAADGVRAVLVAMLQSPHFLYRVEGVGTPDGASVLDDYDLASKLSYALWNTMPDDTLLDTADQGLGQAALEAQVQRMLADQQAREMVGDLHRQLLHVDSYQNIPRDFESHEDYSVTASAAMQAEAYAFVDDIVFGGGTVRDLLTSNKSFADSQLAEIYGVDGVEGVGADALEPVELDPEQRAGLMTLSGFLAYYSESSEPNLIGRGAFVNQVFICAEIPAPPADVPPLPESDGTETLRERIELHTSGCGGSCHNDLINPVGFAFGRYAAGGSYTVPSGLGLPHSNEEEIDATGSYAFEDGTFNYDGAVQLARIMAERRQVHRCYVSHLMAYMEGRSLTDDDAERLDALAEASFDNTPILDLISTIVLDPAFRGLAAGE